MTLRHRLRSTLDRAAQFSGLLHRSERAMARGLTILMYHRVLTPSAAKAYPLPSLAMPVEAFAAQMRWLARHTTVVPLGNGVQRLTSGRLSGRPLVAVTFDDGYADNAEIAAPILSDLGLGATFFVAIDFVRTGAPLWYDRVAAAWDGADVSARIAMLEAVAGRVGHGTCSTLHQLLEIMKALTPNDRDAVMVRIEQCGGTTDRAGDDRFRPMSVEQLRRLHQQGHEIGSHTVTHPILPLLDEEHMCIELTESRRWLEDNVGVGVVGFSYPNGDYDSTVRERVAEAGYAYAVITSPGLNEPGADCLALHRLDITPQRVLDANGNHDEPGFRAEISRVRRLWRGRAG